MNELPLHWMELASPLPFAPFHWDLVKSLPLIMYGPEKVLLDWNEKTVLWLNFEIKVLKTF